MGAGHVERRARVDPGADDDDAVDPLGEQRLDVLAPAGRVVARVAQEDRDLGVAERVLDPGDDRQAKPAVPVGREQPDREAAPPPQAVGQVVGPEAEPLGGGPDALPRLWPELAAVVERLRGGPDRDPGCQRDVVDGRSAPDLTAP
jgi:hypothetical protein